MLALSWVHRFLNKLLASVVWAVSKALAWSHILSQELLWKWILLSSKNCLRLEVFIRHSLNYLPSQNHFLISFSHPLTVESLLAAVSILLLQLFFYSHRSNHPLLLSAAATVKTAPASHCNCYGCLRDSN